MQKQERIEQVLKMIKSQKFCTVEQLVNALHYSPATIRRDLTHLAQKGLIEKSYGGASFVGTGIFAEREHLYTAEKARLCHAAGELIRDGDTVFVDGTTTTYYLRDALFKKQHLTVITTNLKLAIDLCDHGVNCFVPGGQLCDTMMLGGSMAAQTLERFFFDIAFFSPGRVSYDGGLSIPEVFVNHTHTVLKNARRRVCLYGQKKFVPQVNYCFDDLGAFDVVVSNAEFPGEFADSFPDTEFMLVK